MDIEALLRTGASTYDSVFCIEEMPWRRGVITIDRLVSSGNGHEMNEYGKYLVRINRDWKVVC